MYKRNIYIMCSILLTAQLIGNRSIMMNNSKNTFECESLVNIGLNEATRISIAQQLNNLLSDEYVLAVKTKKYHWNIVGPFFGSLHALFDEQYGVLNKVIDDVAERVRALGCKAYGTLTEFIAHSSLTEEAGVNPNAQKMIKNLLLDHEAIIGRLGDYIEYTVEQKDLGTENFLADLIVKHQKIAWMLRAHLLSE